MRQLELEQLIDKLNHPNKKERLVALRDLRQQETSLPPGRDVNNHIHTFYSFSPYSPTKAVYMAARAGLATAGIMDHDTVAGIREFRAAGHIWGLPTTGGAECRASFAATPLAGRRINNPDQDDLAYVALHGIPDSQVEAVAEFFQPIQLARTRRNRRMTRRLNGLLAPLAIELDYAADILPLSQAHDQGQVTERHLLYAAALQLEQKFGAGQELIGFLQDGLKLALSSKVKDQLQDRQNPYLAYDLLGLLKGELGSSFYLPANEEECPPIDELAEFAKNNGIILAYPYLGDVTDSVTGDKKAQAFEDSYLPEHFTLLKQLGFNAITYMPSRNTRAQLLRLRQLCLDHGFFQISGEDINQPRQAFVCQAMRDPLFANLYDAAWALIGHELLAGQDLEQGMFSKANAEKMPDLTERINYYKNQALSAHGQS